MRIEFDRRTCSAWFQCVQHWDAFEMNIAESKADLEDAEEIEDDLFARAVPEAVEEDAKNAAEACPVDAIEVYDDDGNQIVPST